MRTIALPFLAFVVATGLAACRLEETGATFISPDAFYQNDAQAASAVNGVYAPLMDWNGWKQPAQHSIMCDDDEMLCWNWMGGGFSGQSAGQWYMQDNAVWFGDYQIIERANEVVANVARSAGITQAMKQTATGQALFARAYAYFDSAGLAAQQVMSSGTASLEAKYMDLFDVNKQNTSAEVLFAVQGATVNLLGSNIPSFFGPRGDCGIVGGCGQGFMSVREDFYRTFEVGDKRVEPNKAIAHTWEVTLSPFGRIRAIHTDSLATLRASGVVARDQAFRWGNWSEGCGSFEQQFDSLTLRDAADPTRTTTAIYAIGRPIQAYQRLQRFPQGELAANPLLQQNPGY